MHQIPLHLYYSINKTFITEYVKQKTIFSSQAGIKSEFSKT